MIEGQRVDRYQLDKTLHVGEFTTIFRGTHEILGIRQALKIENAGAPEEISRALLQEAKVQASVHHRNVLRVSDALTWERRVVLVMDYVRSESLADLLDRKGTLPLRASLSLFRGVVRGVRAMHVHNVVHRDLKPENILLSKEEGRVVPKVCDFGLAKVLEPGKPPTATGLSTAFRYMGTPEYMAPEQAANPGTVDTRADLFSLGAILYELVTGVIAFESERPVEAMYKAGRGDYARVSTLVERLPDGLEGLIDGMLRPRPGERVSTCDELLERLDPIRV